MQKRSIKGCQSHAQLRQYLCRPRFARRGKLKIKTGLVVEIIKAIRRLELTQQEAATAWTHPTQGVRNDGGNFANLSERNLMDCLNRLGYDIEIKVKPATRSIGYLKLAVA